MIAQSSGKCLLLAVVTCSELDQTCLPLMSHANQAHLRYLVNPPVTRRLMGRLGCLLPYYLISNNVWLEGSSLIHLVQWTCLQRTCVKYTFRL